MSGQDQTTANKPSEPLLCKMGCGFFGNGATGGCCSKCWREHMKMQGGVEATAAPSSGASAAPPRAPLSPAAKETVEPEPMDVEPEALTTTTTTPRPAVPTASPSATEAPAPSSQTKKKKSSYKSVMASIKKQQSSERDVEKEKEALRKVTGGGAFSKIDKI